MCTEYAENGLQVGLHRARHVLDSLSSWTPCTRARYHHCRVAIVCRRASYPSATRCRMPYSSLTKRQSCPVPSRSLARALDAPERSRLGCRRQASVPPLLPLLQPSYACTECRYASVASRRPSRAPFSVTAAAGAPSPPVPAGSSHWLLWPAVYGPSPSVLCPSVGQRRPPLAVAPPLAAGEEPHRLESPFPAILYSGFRPGTSRKNLM